MLVDAVGHAFDSVARRHGLSLHNNFAHSLNSIWLKARKPRRLGLAISGGVDSMALASLCRDAVRRNSVMALLLAMDRYPRTEAEFTAFIVNHRLREGSGDEAQLVAQQISNMGIEAKILELDWTAHGQPKALTNLESIARRLRYQALGAACAKARISTLLLAHHGDDQAETILSRVLSNYLGTGLAGMRETAPIPECAGIYGADTSGSPRRNQHTLSKNLDIPIEYGGVSVCRPLLNVPKESLIDICVSGGVKWFEDHTNTDRSLTLRNTVRFLQRSDVLPAALRQGRLRQVSSKVAEINRSMENEAEDILRKMNLALDLRGGVLRITLPQDSTLETYATSASVLPYVVRKLLNFVAPKDDIELRHLDSAVDFVFRSRCRKDVDEENQKCHIAGVLIQRSRSSNARDPGSLAFIFSRATPTRAERTDVRVQLWSPSVDRRDNESDESLAWWLWDGRYWISVSAPREDNSQPVVMARFLREDHVAALRKDLSKGERRQLENCLGLVRSAARYTLPVIVAKQNSIVGDTGTEVERIVALPSLGWSIPGWKQSTEPSNTADWHWDIRYKHINLKNEGTHSLVS